MVHRRYIKIATVFLKYIDKNEKYNILESVIASITLDIAIQLTRDEIGNFVEIEIRKMLSRMLNIKILISKKMDRDT